MTSRGDGGNALPSGGSSDALGTGASGGNATSSTTPAPPQPGAPSAPPDEAMECGDGCAHHRPVSVSSQAAAPQSGAADADMGAGDEAEAPPCPPGPSAEQAFRDFLPAIPAASCSKMDCDSTCESSSGGAAGASAAQALHGVQFHAPQEVLMDGIQLTSQPHADFGALVVTAPPWRFGNLVSSRMYLLVLRNPRDPSRGLTLMTNTSSDVLTQTARGMLSELGNHDAAMLALLSQSETYDALCGDPALLAAIAEAVSQSGALGMQHILGTGSSTGGSSSSSSSGGSGGGAHAAFAAPTPDTAAATSSQPPEEAAECPICFEHIRLGDAAMRCCGEGGVHHYFHAHCLQDWMRACRSRGHASCPVCRGRLQFNGRNLQQFLQSSGSSALTEEERTFLEQVSDGLRGTSGWGDMNMVEKAAYAGGIFAAASWGFMLGYTHRSHQASNMLIVHSVPQEHQLAQGIGWIAGLVVRLIREALKDKEEERRRGRRS